MRKYIPFDLPASVSLPYIGTVTGDGVVYIFIGCVLLIIALIYMAVAIVRGAGARARHSGLGSVPEPSGMVIGSLGAPETTTYGVGPARTLNDIGSGTPYEMTMENIGRHLEKAKALNVCISEVEGGYLLLYDHEGKAEVETLTSEQVAIAPAKVRHAPSDTLLLQLGRIGRFLDQHFAISIMVTQLEEGFYVEYAAPPGGAHSVSKLVRVSRLFDEETLGRLIAP